MTSDLARCLAATYDDPVLFNSMILGRVHPSIPDGYWSKQIEVLESVQRYRKTVVPAAHGVGKSHLASGAALHFVYTRPKSKVLIYSPSFKQLSEVLWAKIRSAWGEKRVPLPGRLLASPLKLEIAPEWSILGLSADTGEENLSGNHPPEMLIICD